MGIAKQMQQEEAGKECLVHLAELAARYSGSDDPELEEEFWRQLNKDD